MQCVWKISTYLNIFECMAIQTLSAREHWVVFSICTDKTCVHCEFWDEETAHDVPTGPLGCHFFYPGQCPVTILQLYCDEILLCWVLLCVILQYCLLCWLVLYCLSWALHYLGHSEFCFALSGALSCAGPVLFSLFCTLSCAVLGWLSCALSCAVLSWLSCTVLGWLSCSENSWLPPPEAPTFVRSSSALWEQMDHSNVWGAWRHLYMHSIDYVPCENLNQITERKLRAVLTS